MSRAPDKRSGARVKLVAEYRWKIPAEKQATALRMAYTGSSSRQVYLALWPGGRDAPVQVDTFTRALQDLVDNTEASVREMAEAAGVPVPSPDAGDEDPIVELGPPKDEEPLPAEMTPGLSVLRAARGVLCQALKDLKDEDLAPPDEKGRANETVTGRAMATAKISEALANNVRVELDAYRFRLDRTIKLVGLRLQPPPGDGEKDGDKPDATPPPDGRRFVLEVPGAKPS